MKKTYGRIGRFFAMFLVVAMMLSAGAVAFAFSDVGYGTNAQQPSHEILSYSHTLCPKCGANAPMYCMNSKVIINDNATKHTKNGVSCTVITYLSYAKYFCNSCRWSELVWNTEGTALAKHSCDTHHSSCGLGTVNTCALGYLPSTNSVEDEEIK